MIDPPRRRFRRAGGALVALLLASCLHTPPSVTPTAKLSPFGDQEGGPRTGSAFAVAYAAPRGEVHDRRDPAITVLFNRGMRSLDTPEDQGLPALDVRTKEGAAIAGKLRWVGTRGLLFVPDAPLPGASRFVVTVPAETKSIDGAALGSSYSFELSTPRPAVVRTYPLEGARSLRPDGPWALTMNQDVAPETLEKALRMVAHRNDGDPGEVVAFHVERAPAPAKPADPARALERAYLVRPDKPLPRDAGIELTLAAGLRGAEGPAPMEKAWKLGARTYGPLTLASFHCARIAREGRCKAHNDVKITLSNPVDPEQIRAHVKAPGLLAKVDPRAKPKRAPATSSEQWIGADPQPGRKYKVTLTAGMKDIFGQALAADTTFELEAESPFTGGSPPPKPVKGKKHAPPPPPPPEREAKLSVPPPVATVPHRASLSYELELGISGTVLEALATTGTRSHKLPVGSVNVPTYQLSTSGLAEPQVLAWLHGGNLSDFVARNHVDPALVTPGAPENVRAVRTVDLDALLGKGGRGAAFVVATVPGEGTVRQAMVRVTDLGITAKASRFGSLVWVTSLATGKPVPGAMVSLRTPEKGEVYASRTDAEGMTEIPADRLDPFGDTKDTSVAKPPAFLFVRAGDDWTYESIHRSATEQRVASGIQDFNAHAETLGMVYTDRGVYRPGETVKVAGLFRAIVPAGMRPTGGDEVRIEAYDGNGESVFTTRVPVDRFGEFNADVKLPKSAHLGDARVTATVHGKGHNAEVTEGFKLAAYKASEFKVEASADAKEYVRGDDAGFEAKAEYLFGGPMMGAGAHTTLTRTVASFTPPGAAGFVTTDDARIADESEVNARSSDLGASDEKLDAEGRASRRARLAMPGQTLPERVTFEVEVEDLSRQTVAQRASALVHPAEIYVALAALKERFVTAGGDLRASVLAIEPSGAHRAGVPVKVELYTRKWISAVEEHGDGGAHRTARLKDELVTSCDVRSAAAAQSCAVKVPEAGYYVLRATAKDPRGNDTTASYTFYGVEDTPRGAPAMAWADGDTRGVKLEANKKTYDIGETARILVQSPFREAEALVTVERAGVMLRKIVHVTGPMPVVEVPVTAEMYPNAYVGVHLLRGRVGTPPEKGADLGGPEFRLGYAELAVNPDAHRLAVTVKPDRIEHRPGEEIDVDLAVADRSGRPVESELTFYAVDEGVLMLTGYKTPDPLPAFARRRPLAVFTVENREDLAQILSMRAGERVSILGYEYDARGDKGDPGGGGGGPIRADFRTTAYFEGGKITNAEGKARVHFKLPDNLTTFRLMAVAADQGDFFGAGEATITTSKKLMARPELPRIVRVGDAFEASVLLSSKDLPDADVEVTLDAKGVDAKGERAQHVRLPKGGTAEVRFPVVATAPGEAKIEMTVRGGGETDSVRATRTVVLPVSVETASVYGETSDAAAITLGDLSRVRSDEGELRLRAAPTALVGLSTSLESLVEYPYGCTEQLSSHLLPLAVLTDLAKDYGAHLPANVPHAVEEAIDAIIKNQRDDGGFGFWEGSEKSEPWLSAYVVLTLDAVKKANNPVPASPLDSAVSYLRSVLGRTTLSDAEPEAPATPAADAVETPENRAPGTLLPEEVARIDYANAAFIADALTAIGSPDPGTITRLYDARKGKPLGARALLLHAMGGGKGSPDLLATLAKEIEGELRVDANEASARYDEDEVGQAIFESPARTTALVLRGLLAADKHHPLAPRLARGLLAMREKGAWRSTQENGWALLALRDYRAAQESTAHEMEARAFLGSDMIGSRVFSGTADAELVATVPAARMLALGGPVTFELVGEGKLFYAAEMRYATAALPREERDHGLFVKKLVRSVKPEELEDAAAWIPKKTGEVAEAGSLVLVDLLLESAEARRQVVIDDPLPSGLEPIETSLDTASKSRTVTDDNGSGKPDEKPRPGALTGIGAAFRTARVHREMHDDRVLTFIEELPPGMYHFRYLTRATSIGRFVVPPTRVEAMYSPEVWGSTAAGSLEVVAKK